MFRSSSERLATRTAGYVFWRQRNLIELEKSKRSYLLNEAPYPVAEIARRMVRVRSKFQATTDFHEQTLLRGEYKYFTGKLLDLRRAPLNDLIAYVETAAAFGFWDTSQIDRIVDELALHLESLTSHQAIHLLIAISGVRKHQSHLYQSVAASLLPRVDDMAFEDALLLTKACEIDDPPPLLEALFARIAVDLERVDPKAAVVILSSMTCVSKSVQLHYEVMVQELKAIIVDELQQTNYSTDKRSRSPASSGGDVTLLEIATVAEALVTLETFDLTTRECLMRAFLFRLNDACPRSLAMMFYACDSSDLARAAEGRVLHHLLRYSTAELYALTKVYVNALDAVSQLVTRRHQRRAPTNPSSATTDPPQTTMAASPLAVTTTSQTSLLEDLEDDLTPLLATSEERRAAEVHQKDLAAVVRELMAQVLLHAESSTVHAEPAVHLGLLRCCAEIQEYVDLVGGVVALKQTVHALCARIVSSAREMSVDELMEFIILSSRLGTVALHASVVSSMDILRARISVAAHHMTTATTAKADQTFVITSADAAVLFNTLNQLTGLNVLQRRKLDGDILPLLRKRVGEDDVAFLRF
ncbi:Hypothetical protein, putative [Bodo saltans]|uniref:Uncharacterized protein n=1 Tax=Bodo saltans TaxID=75058 RepID=A0A0S4IMI7_BODSA|nr:Hypothetical protein, putative [Bodo saltans]|eukprot:CUE73046.1 Hypothetical protein, putative [Bodo saltans]